MKKIMVIMVVLAAGGVAHGSYTYTYGPGTNFGSLDLNDYETMLVNGGGGNSLTLLSHSFALIESTTQLTHPYTSGGHGIPDLNLSGYSSLVVTGGQIGELEVHAYGQATISGGLIEYLYGTLYMPIPAIPADKYIQFICKSWDYNSTTKRLTGTWADDSLFNIQLMDTAGYPTTYDSINFTIVPEPLTLALLGIGAGLLRMRRSRT